MSGCWVPAAQRIRSTEMIGANMSENLRQLHQPAWLFEADDLRRSDIGADYFRGRVPGCSVVVCQCCDGNKTVILDLNSHVEKTY
jgi:hypothetical protein